MGTEGSTDLEGAQRSWDAGKALYHNRHVSYMVYTYAKLQDLHLRFVPFTACMLFLNTNFKNKQNEYHLRI